MNNLSAIKSDSVNLGDLASAPADLQPENVNRTQETPGPMPGRRRRFTSDEKRQFIAQAMAPGESMSSVGRRHGLSVSLLFRWRRQLESDSAKSSAGAVRTEARELRDRVRELERLLGRKTLEVELLQKELQRLGHNPGAALSALDNELATSNA